MIRTLIRNCTIKECVSADEGGGVYCDAGAQPKFRKCTFKHNLAEGQGGGLYASQNAVVTILDSVFDTNAAGFGGGLITNRAQTIKLIDVTFKNNTALRGGGMELASSNDTSVTMTNCLLHNNSATLSSGGGINAYGTVLTMTNCTVADNSTDDVGGGLAVDAVSVTITNCIFWGNTATGGSAQIAGTATITYSDVQGGPTGTGGNINANPLFVGTGNYRLSCGSPCINAGLDSAVPTDGEDVNENGNTTTETTPDRDLMPRVVGPHTDMG